MRKITIFFAVAVSCIISMLNTDAQTLKVVCWNVRSFEDGTPAFSITSHVEKIQAYNPDIVCFNEFETDTDRVGKEKMAEVAAAMGMYGYFIMSYPKDSGYYGNVILSKYPIVNSESVLLPYKNAKGEGYYQFNSGAEEQEYGADQRSTGFADILVPSGNSTRIVRIVCSHFDHMGNESVRTRQASVSVKMAGLDSPVYPTIMMGDLNTTSTSTLAPLYDNGDIVGINWVDHIFTFPKDKISASGFTPIPHGGLSDHNAIYAELTIN